MIIGVKFTGVGAEGNRQCAIVLACRFDDVDLVVDLDVVDLHRSSLALELGQQSLTAAFPPTFVQEPGSQALAPATAVKRPQRIGRHRHDPQALAVVDPHQHIALAKVELFPDGGRDDGLPAARDRGLGRGILHIGNFTR